MFCAGCGSQIQSGLNYCSRCGRRVAEEGKWSSARSPNVVAGNTAGVGFVSYIFVLLIMSKTGVEPNMFIPVTFIYFAALFGMCFMFLRQGFVSPRNLPDAERSEPAYIQPVTTAQLGEPIDRPASVTENTTRTLDSVTVDRN